MIRFEVRPVILDMLEIQRWDVSYATFRGPPCHSRHARNTEGAHSLCYVSGSALSLDILEIQKWDHFLCYVSRSALSLDMLEIQWADHFLMLRFWVRPFIRHVRNTEVDHFLCYVSRSALSLDM